MKRFSYAYIYLSIIVFCCAARLEAAPTIDAANSADEAAIMEKAAAIEMKELVKKAHNKGRARVIIQFKEKLGTKDLAKFRQKQGGNETGIIEFQQKELMKEVSVKNKDTIKRYKHMPYMAMSVTEEELIKLRSSERVEDIFEDKIDVSQVENVSKITRDIGADIGWNLGYTGRGQSVVVIDSGVFRQHPYLRGRVVREACFSSREEDKASGIQVITPVCRGGRTVVYGKGAANVDCRVGDVGCAHGTYVALLAAGNSGAANFRGSGIAPEAKIIAIKAESNFIDCGGGNPCKGFNRSDELRSLDYVLGIHRRLRVAAVNMSLGGPGECFRNPLRRAIRLLRKAGVATIISSGNDGTPYTVSQPACIPEAISVGATNAETHQISEFSNGARNLDLLAPGEGIIVPNFNVDPLEELAIDGTSFSAPIVTGAWASLKSHKPKASVEELLNALKSTGVGILDVRNATIKPEIRIDRAHNSLGP